MGITDFFLRLECCWIILIDGLFWSRDIKYSWRWWFRCFFRNSFITRILWSKLYCSTFLGIKTFLFHKMVVQVHKLLRCVWWSYFDHFELSLVRPWLLKIFVCIHLNIQLLRIYHFDIALLLSCNLLLDFIVLVDFLVHFFEVNLERKWGQLHLVGLLIIQIWLFVGALVNLATLNLFLRGMIWGLGRRLLVVALQMHFQSARPHKRTIAQLAFVRAQVSVLSLMVS